MFKSDINLNLYKIFYEVASLESISKAAKRLFLTQSAVSKGVKKLESDLNISLFYRDNRGVKLTDKGKELFYYVEEAFNNLIIAERTMIESETLNKGKISIGVPSQIGSFFIFEDITNFHKEFPNIEITIISKGTTELLKLLERHELDFVIDTSPINTNLDNIIVKPLKVISNSFIVNSSSSLDYKKIKSICDLSNYPLVLPIKGTDNRKQLDNIFDTFDVKINNVLNIHTSEMIVGAVKKCAGIGYIINDVVKDMVESGDFKIVNVKEKLPSIEINLVYIDKYLTTAPRYFIEKYLNIDMN